MDPRIVYLTNVRLSYPNLAAPQKLKNDDGTEKARFGASFLLDAGDPQFQKFVARCTEIATETWKEHANVVLQQIYGDRKARCFSRGEENIDSKSMQVRAGYAGTMVIAAGGERQPQAIGADGQVVPPENSLAVVATLRKLYGGCRVNVALKPWPQMARRLPNGVNIPHGIRCDIVAIQFAKDDTPFGEAAPDVSGVFGAVEQSAQGFGAPVAPAAPFGMPIAPGGQSPFTGLPPLPPFPGAQ